MPKPTKTRAKSYLAALVAATGLLTCGCSTEGTEPEVPKPEGVAEMTVRLEVASISGEAMENGTRSGEYEPGNAAEDFIDIGGNNIRVMFFDSTDRFITEYTYEQYLLLQLGGRNVYHLTGRVPEEIKGMSIFRLMIAANWPAYPQLVKGETTLSQLCADAAAAFTSTGTLSLSDKNLVPLYGIAECSGVNFIPGERTVLPSVNLIRALAKIEILVDTEPGGDYCSHRMVSGLMKGFNLRGLPAPKNGHYTTDLPGGYVTALNLVGDANEPTAMSNTRTMTEVSEPGARVQRFITYVPEFANTISPSVYSSIDLRFDYQSPADTPFTLYFANYDSEGKVDNTNMSNRYDILRNNLYRFNVKLYTTVIEYNLTVERWQHGGSTEIIM